MTDRATQPGEPEQHHETPEEFVEEAEVAAWQTVEEVKDLPHDARRLAHEAAEKARHIAHRDKD